MNQTEILLTLQQSAGSSSPAIFSINIGRISKQPKLLTTTIPTFDGKSEEFEMFGLFLQRSLKSQNQLAKEEKISFLLSSGRMRGRLQKHQQAIPKKSGRYSGSFVLNLLQAQLLALAEHKSRNLSSIHKTKNLCISLANSEVWQKTHSDKLLTPLMKNSIIASWQTPEKVVKNANLKKGAKKTYCHTKRARVIIEWSGNT